PDDVIDVDQIFRGGGHSRIVSNHSSYDATVKRQQKITQAHENSHSYTFPNVVLGASATPLQPG
ncbi:hypothetical protein, partial [Bifidobacterium crudilactis]|uniref:hypothetical protein n=1 Tax=Bifidobacterium crudilactis TaxID=327277 RepID=UPI0026470A52